MRYLYHALVEPSRGEEKEVNAVDPVNLMRISAVPEEAENE